MLDWLIVGGGIHGTFLSRALVEEGRVSADRVRVLDPWPESLTRFRECAANCAMDYLRSSLVHHLDREPLALQDFAARRGWGRDAFLGPYARPRVDLFDSHCRDVIERRALDALRIRGSATAMRRRSDGWCVETDHGSLEARRVALALGSGDRPEWPAWALTLRAAGARVDHLFDPGFRLPAGAPGATVLVGGGISALQAAQALARTAPAGVDLVTRHAVRIHDFDTDSGWLGPLRRRRFERSRSYEERRRAIGAARHRGSAPRDVVSGFEAAVARGEIRVHRDDVANASAAPDGRAVLELAGGRLEADRVLLATGFAGGPPGGSLFDSLSREIGLECAPCGFPVPDARLRWDRGLYVTGPLAELELGPAARNIHGAREAGKRLVDATRNG